MTALPREWPVFPLGSAFLPGDPVGLTLFEPRYLEMITGVLVGDGRFASVLISEGSEVGGADRRFDHGVVVEVHDAADLPGRILVRGRALGCWRAVEWLHDDPYPRAIGVEVAEPVVEGRARFDIASSISLLAQAVSSIRSMLGADEVTSREPGLAGLAGGRWWDERGESERLWEAFWLLARAIPCGAYDRHSFMLEGELSERVRRVRAVVEHVSEIIRFRNG